MKKLYTLVLFLSIIFSSTAKDWVGITSSSPKSARIELISSDVQTTVIKATVPGFFKNDISTPHGTGSVISLEGAYELLQAGAPDLVKLSTSIVIPDKAKMKVEIISSEYTDVLNYESAPSKGNLYRNISRDDVPYTFGESYSRNSFYPGTLAALQSPYIVRDYRGQAIWVYPFQYNPVTKVLRVNTEITVKISVESDQGENVFMGNRKPKTDTEFPAIYSKLFSNYKSLTYTPVEETGSMLVICYNTFMNDMKPFVDWKIKRGLPTEMVDVATAGSTATAIKTFIVNYYNSHNLKYILLVGDAAQVPTLTASGGASDPSYGYIVGNDSYPEVFVGRFSAQTSADVQTQVQRVIDYERYPDANAAWYGHGVGLASNLGPGDDNEMDWEHERNIRSKLLAFSYDQVGELYDGTHGISDASGDPGSSDFVSILDSGVSIVNYTGHGSQTAFVTTGFSSSNMSQLTNYHMLPFICSVGCVNGDFTSGTCLAETFMRSQNGGQPTGAIATFMSSINQSWSPPMRAQDELVDLLVGTHAGNSKRTFGGLCENGCMNMNDVYGAGGVEMTDTWHCFGDPSLCVRTATPTVITAVHAATIDTGTTQLSISCNTEDALVSLTVNGQIIGTGIVASGNALVNFPAVNSLDTIYVTITAFNAIPYEGMVITVIPTTISVSETSSAINYLNINPNPASGNVSIRFHLENNTSATLKIFNSLSQEVRTVLEDSYRSKGDHQFTFNTKDFGKGIYFVKLITDSGEHVRRLVIE